MLFVALSLLLFTGRGILMMADAKLLQTKLLKIAPHIIDTLLLVSAIFLMFKIHQYPFANQWLTAKLIALIVYIGLGTIAIKRGKTKQIKIMAFFAAITVFIYMGAVAKTKMPFPFL